MTASPPPQSRHRVIHGGERGDGASYGHRIRFSMIATRSVGCGFHYEGRAPVPSRLPAHDDETGAQKFAKRWESPCRLPLPATTADENETDEERG